MSAKLINMSEMYHVIKHGESVFQQDILIFFFPPWSESKYPECVTNHSVDILDRSGRRRGGRILKR